MTHESAPNLPHDAQLQPFAANIVPTGRIRTGHLRELLQRYAQGATDPLILGENGAPQAAIIPFSEFLRLMRYDQAQHVGGEATFQEEVRHRVNSAPVDPDQLIASDEDFTAWAQRFTPPEGGDPRD